MSGFFAKKMKEETSNKLRDVIQEMSSLPDAHTNTRTHARTHFRSIRKLRLNMCGSTGEQICVSASMFPHVFFVNAIPAACQQLTANKPRSMSGLMLWAYFFGCDVIPGICRRFTKHQTLMGPPAWGRSLEGDATHWWRPARDVH